MGRKIIKVQFAGTFDFFSDFGLKNARSASNYQSAFKGLFDMAKRTGTYYHDWGEFQEPILTDSQKKFGKKSVTMNFFTEDISRTRSAFETSNFINSDEEILIFEKDIDTNTEETIFEGKYTLKTGPSFTRLDGTDVWSVKIGIEVEDSVSPTNFVTNDQFSGEKIISAGQHVPLLLNCGLHISSIAGLYDFGNRIAFSNIEYPETGGGQFSKVILSGTVQAVSFADFEAKLRNLRALLRGFDASPLRYHTKSGYEFDFFVSNGFTVNTLFSDYSNEVFASVSVFLNKI